MSESTDQELDLEVAGQKIRAKNYRLLDLLWVPIVLMLGYCSFILYTEKAAAQTEKQVTAKTLIDSNAAVAQTLKDSNKAIVDALREANENTVRALDRNTAEQRKSTKTMREMACLVDPAMQRRSDARDFCKRLARGDDS